MGMDKYTTERYVAVCDGCKTEREAFAPPQDGKEKAREWKSEPPPADLRHPRDWHTVEISGGGRPTRRLCICPTCVDKKFPGLYPETPALSA